MLERTFLPFLGGAVVSTSPSRPWSPPSPDPSVGASVVGAAVTGARVVGADVVGAAVVGASVGG